MVRVHKTLLDFQIARVSHLNFFFFLKEVTRSDLYFKKNTDLDGQMIEGVRVH